MDAGTPNQIVDFIGETDANEATPMTGLANQLPEGVEALKEITIYCHGEEFRVKCIEEPKNCSKCNNRRHRGKVVDSKYTAEHGHYPVLCNCIKKVMVIAQDLA